jgi:uncharacterized damage-inducible protein DinB
MLTTEIISKHFEYNYWANGRILAKAVLVGEENFAAPSAVEGRSLQQVLAHMIRTEKVWRLLARDGQLMPAQLPAEDELRSVEAIRALANQEQKEMQALLENFTADDLAEELEITRWDGVKLKMTRWQMLVHLALHSMQHRSEAAVLLTQNGHSPGNLDFLFFVL